MRVTVFSSKAYDRKFLQAANASRHELRFLEPRLNAETVSLAAGFEAVCVFVNDRLDAAVIAKLTHAGTRLIALRCAGYNNVNLAAAARHGLAVVRVPAYSPQAVAEHTIGLILSLDRKLHRAYNRVREGNFALDGLLGFDLCGRAAASSARQDWRGGGADSDRFGCEVLAFDPMISEACRSLGASYTTLDDLLARSDIVTLHCPLRPENRHVINRAALAKMKHGVMLINTSRGALVDTVAVIEALKSGRVGYLGLDVYEEEEDIFFEDRSDLVISDDVFSHLLTFPNVIITGHQAFFTREALESIAATTMQNITEFEGGRASGNELPTSGP